MKNLILISIAIYTASCSGVKHSIADKNSNSEIDIVQILSEIQEKGLDTVIVYEIGCVGCIIKPHTYYFFTKSNTSTTVRKVIGNYTSKIINIDDVFTFYYDNFRELNIENSPFTASLLHYRYKRVSVYENRNLIFLREVQIPNSIINKDDAFNKFIHLIDSELMWIESNEIQWNN